MSPQQTACCHCGTLSFSRLAREAEHMYCLNLFSSHRGPSGGQGECIHLEGLEVSRLQIKLQVGAYSSKAEGSSTGFEVFPFSLNLMHRYSFPPFNKRFVVIPSCDKDSFHPPSCLHNCLVFFLVSSRAHGGFLVNKSCSPL